MMDGDPEELELCSFVFEPGQKNGHGVGLRSNPVTWVSLCDFLVLCAGLHTR